MSNAVLVQAEKFQEHGWKSGDNHMDDFQSKRARSGDRFLQTNGDGGPSHGGSTSTLPLRAFTATFRNIPGQPTGRSGIVLVFITNDTTVAYSGFASNLDPFLSPSDCTAINGM